MTPKTIGHFGPARGGVRIYEDAQRQLVTVFWRAHGRRLKRSWPLTTAGRKEAKAFAKAMVEEWAAGGNRAPLTTRALWDLYIADQAHLRPRSRILYTARWAKWQLFVGADFLAEQATGLTMAEFTAALRKVGHAVNQIAEHVKQVKIVYAWGRAHQALAHNDLAGYRFKRGKDEPKNEPGEYRSDELELLLAELDPRSSRSWRAHAVLQFIGAQGVRINAALNLRWRDLVGDRVAWPIATDKTGRQWAQPLRIAAWAALETARYWRGRDGYVGEFVFYSSHRQTARGDQHYKVQALWQMLRNAEDRAEVSHRPWRAAHGFRRMVTGDLWEEFGGDLKLVMDFTGHTDLRSFQKYLRQRDDRLAAAIAAADARERDPESGTGVTPEPVGMGVSDWDDRATGRVRTDDREHPTSADRSASPQSVASSPAEDRSTRALKRGKSHPKAAPKRHPPDRRGRR